MPFNHKVALLFTGQGSQWPHMATVLYQEIPSLRKKIEADCNYFLNKHHIDITSIYNENCEFVCDIHQTQFTQPALVIFEISLAEHLLSLGLKPNYVIGHSIGELAASYIAGFYTKEEIFDIVAHRAKQMQKLPAIGSMLACRTDKENTEKILGFMGKSSTVQIAGINSPQQTILSGETETLENYRLKLKNTGIKSIPLQVSHAFHSNLMNPMLKPFQQNIDSILSKDCDSRPKLILNQAGEIADSNVITPTYWCKQIIQPVNYVQCIQNAYKLGVQSFIEVGPQPILLKLAQKILHNHSGLYFLSCYDQKNPHTTLKEALKAISKNV